jgi:hypothetical protein
MEGDLTNVQYKPIQNCHNESPLYNEYILIKMKEETLSLKSKILQFLKKDLNIIVHKQFSLRSLIFQRLFCLYLPCSFLAALEMFTNLLFLEVFSCP